MKYNIPDCNLKRIINILLKKYYILICTIFCFGIGTVHAQFTVLYNFSDSATGEVPVSSLIFSGGKFYGMTGEGGTYYIGTVFSIDTNGSNYRDIHDFNDTDGGYPQGSLTLSNGVLYGMTSQGGTHKAGVVFSMDTNGNNYTVLLNFDTLNGASPYGYGGGPLILDNVLYGTTGVGGKYDSGCIFSIHTDGSGYRKLFDFNSSTGFYPSGLIYISGKFFGTTDGATIHHNGVVFSIDTNGSGYKALFSFDSSKQGFAPQGNLTFSGNKFYGVMSQGGDSNDGTVFSIDTNGSAFKVMYSFGSNPNDIQPLASLLLVGGKLYGTTDGDVAYIHDGNIFSIDTSGANYTDLFDFNGPTGDNSLGALTVLGSNLYGTTASSGIDGSGHGEIFRYNLNDTLTSINQLPVAGKQWSVYPNPSINGVFTVAINNYQLGINNQVEVYNMMGEKIAASNSSKGGGFYSLPSGVEGWAIDISNQPAGIYLYRIITDNGECIASGKLIIQK
ncbi:MAG: choice-of-anchor tandem repeat GloVer-containing protein [Bacteroidia bacterium]